MPYTTSLRYEAGYRRTTTGAFEFIMRLAPRKGAISRPDPRWATIAAGERWPGSLAAHSFRRHVYHDSFSKPLSEFRCVQQALGQHATPPRCAGTWSSCSGHVPQICDETKQLLPPPHASRPQCRQPPDAEELCDVPVRCPHKVCPVPLP